ncbi:Ger(x)C family germination protein [Paenibacillus taihuensis]|uniref:Ger(X)C family germination protein n=1 Tax=Paenibacillus taihuensis TaxID=1156355 RepID=A0A3D9S772_9BACL|nr:Ger(x)C family spore germination protein [Paenibacillus taihuensis]REE89016.1 Ger(x)C family germination protein [Paenibacillus taihuensis]
MKPILVAAALSLLLLTGCWDNKDINHRALPIAMGIGYKNGDYTVYLDIPKVSASEKGIEVYSEHGKSINEAIDLISMNLESQVDLLHLKVIVVDKPFALHGLEEGIASIIRSRYIAPKTVFVICDQPLDRFFKRIDDSSNDGKSIYDFFQKDAGWSPQIAFTQVWKIFRSVHSYTNDVVLPIIKAGDTTILESTGSAIMKNGVMVGRLTNEQTLLYNVFNGDNLMGKIEVMNHATVQIVSNRLRCRGRFQQGKPILKSTLYLKVIIVDTTGNPSTEKIKTELKILVTDRFNEIFKIVRRDKADIFGLGQHFRDDFSRKELSQWREKYLPQLQIELDVKTVVRNTGNLKSP